MLNNCHLSKLIHEQAKRYGDRTALTYRDYDRNCWLPVSWKQFSQTVGAVSRSLLSLGVEEQERIAVFSQNKPECMYVDFGAYGIKGVTVPFYATSSGMQVSYILNDAEVRYIFVGEQQQYDTVFSVISLCSTLEKIIIFDPKVKKNEKDHLSIYFSEFLDLGKNGDFTEEIHSRMESARFEDTVNILYTSGTTGASKGVILTYGMFREGFRVNNLALDLSDKDIVLNFLPFTHVFERAWSYWCLAEGAQLAVNLRPADVLRSMQEVHPTCMCSVPRFWEKVYQAVLEKMESGSFMERKLIREALEVGGRCWIDYKSKGKPLPASLSLKYGLYKATIIKLLRKTLGLEHAHFFPTAGAAVPPEVEKFAHAAGINMIVGYGLTESTATVSCDVPGKPITMGSVGRVVDGLEIKFGENNEILLRGKTITPGYYKRESATKAAIDADGWFHTGDAGYMKDGELFLTERIKDLFKTSNGKYIAPQMIESKLVIDRYIEQGVVVADQYKFVSALIVPNYHLLENFATENNIAYHSREELCSHPLVHKMIGSRIETLQQELAHYEKIKSFLLLPEPFSIENGELTNTLKVKRRVVYERYAAQIKQMYEDAEREHAQVAGSN